MVKDTKPKRRLITTKGVLTAIALGVITVAGVEFSRVKLADKFYNSAVSIAKTKGIPEARVNGRRREIWDSLGISRPPKGKAALTLFYTKMIHRSYTAEKRLLNEVKSGKILKQMKPIKKEKPRAPKQHPKNLRNSSVSIARATKQMPRSNLPRRRRRA